MDYEEVSMAGNRRADGVSMKIGGDLSGQVAIGQDIHQARSTTRMSSDVTGSDFVELAAEFARVRQQLAVLPRDIAKQAERRLGELEEVVTSAQPDVGKMADVRGWFARKVPSLASAVTRLVVHPIVGKVVAAAGDSIAADFHDRFHEFL
jgi:hypothetical protein